MRRALAFAVTLMLTLACFVGGARHARAEDPEESPERTEQARAEFARGNELGKKEDWAEAMAAFERSYTLKPHPTTRYNIATCLRVLGRYAAARAMFEDVLRPGKVELLPASLVENARGYTNELDRILAHVTITIDPPDAKIAIDGRPLALASSDGAPVATAGVRPSGPGEQVPAATFEVLVDPGTRVIVLSREGRRDVIRSERFAPGAREALRLDLEKLPATLRITANVDNPVVTVNGTDVGQAPVNVSRIAGTYRVVVTKEGFVPHVVDVHVDPGDVPKVDARLVPEKVPITKRWWFWSGAAAILAGGVALTYALTRPDPQPPDYERGNTGWLVNLGR